MPTTTLSVPVLVQTVHEKGERLYKVRPALHSQPYVTDRRYAEAISKFKSVLRHQASTFLFERGRSYLLWFKTGMEVTLSHFDIEFSIGSHFIKGNFAVASFELQGNLYACLPELNNFYFIVPKKERGKYDLKETAEKVIQQLIKDFKKNLDSKFNPSFYYSSKKEFITNVRLSVPVKVSAFNFENETPLDFFASLRKMKEFDGKSEIRQVGVDLCEKYPDRLARAWQQDEMVELLYSLVFQKGNIPLVLVGPDGVGKHTMIDEVVFRYMEHNKKADDEWQRHSVWHINPNRVIAGMSIVGQWERRFEAILTYLKKPDDRPKFTDKILIDNPIALLRIGKAAQSDLTLANVLKPTLEKRHVQVLLIATPEEWKIMQESDRSFSDLFQVIRIQEPDLKTSIRIVLQNRRQVELQHSCEITMAAIMQLFTLQRNYLKNKALPGSVMKLLIQLSTKYSRRLIDAQEVREEFKSYSGLKERIFDEHTVLEGDEIKEMFSQELVGQPSAVEALSEAVHLIKAKLTARNRPLASFLFIGPTGVGKTHAAKLLCKTLLRSESHLLRFDMNEYIDAGALDRLIGDRYNPEGQLTGKVRYRPFSIILLDEIEKAHPAIHDLLLQVLDDARLTDSLGRTVDFSNSIIVMTSNLGAREAGAQIGFGHQTSDDGAVYRKAIENFFRPELVNRIERTIVFNPLAFSEIQKIAQLQIRELLQREGFVRRSTIVNVAPEALDWVARRGFDERMGGRALKRQIERDLTLLSAEQLIKTTNDTPLILHILLENGQLIPRITPLEFALQEPVNKLPELPEYDNTGRFYSKLLKKLDQTLQRIDSFERHRQKESHLYNVAPSDTDWKHYYFKNKVHALREQILFKKLRRKERNQPTPVLTFRLKRVYLESLSGKARRNLLRDRFFQEEALYELKEGYRHASPQFDSTQTDFLLSFLDVNFIERMLEGFLNEKADKVTLRFESAIANAGDMETGLLSDLYADFFEKMDIPFSRSEDKKLISAEEYGLAGILTGEQGYHLFNPLHHIPIPIALHVAIDEEEAPPDDLTVIRVYNAMETVTDLRSGYTSAIGITSDDMKLLVYLGMSEK